VVAPTIKTIKSKIQTKIKNKIKIKFKTKQKRMEHALLNATNAQLSSRKRCNDNNTLYPKNTYWRDPVLPNEKDEPKMTKARCILRRRCRYLQCVRDGEGGAAVAAPTKHKNKIKIKFKTKQKRMEHALLNATNAQLSSRKRCNDNNTLYPKNTYWRDPVLPNEKDEPKMTKARCILRRRCRYLQCVRDGEGGAAVAAPINPTNKIKIKANKSS
jgi:hypothetical protein